MTLKPNEKEIMEIAEFEPQFKAALHELQLRNAKSLSIEYEEGFALFWGENVHGKFNLYICENEIKKPLLGASVKSKLRAKKYINEFMQECLR